MLGVSAAKVNGAHIDVAAVLWSSGTPMYDWQTRGLRDGRLLAGPTTHSSPADAILAGNALLLGGEVDEVTV